MVDASKFFYNFLTCPEEQKFLGCAHPVTGEQLHYAGIPMGCKQSPAIACRFDSVLLRVLKDESPAFQGTPIENTWRSKLRGAKWERRLGHG